MMDEVTEFLYKYVINNNPFLHEEDIDYVEALSNHDLMITFKNGSKEIYDTFANTSHRVTHISRRSEDDQLRREFRQRLQIMMNRAWVNQEELAKRIDSTQPMISRYLTGQSIPSAITLKKIARALGCSTDDFYEQHY